MITQTEVELYVRIKPYYEFVEFVSTMPGMTMMVQCSTIVKSKTGVDFGYFWSNQKRSGSWAIIAIAKNDDGLYLPHGFRKKPFPLLTMRN